MLLSPFTVPTVVIALSAQLDVPSVFKLALVAVEKGKTLKDVYRLLKYPGTLKARFNENLS